MAFAKGQRLNNTATGVIHAPGGDDIALACVCAALLLLRTAALRLVLFSPIQPLPTLS